MNYPCVLLIRSVGAACPGSSSGAGVLPKRDDSLPRPNEAYGGTRMGVEWHGSGCVRQPSTRS